LKELSIEKVKLSMKQKEFQFVTIPDLTQKKKVKEEKGEEKKEKGKKEEEKKLIYFADIRVGKILNVKKHEDADSLYVEEIDVGEETPRTICSGLVKHMQPEDLQDKFVLVFCNLKPKNARGIMSNGMVICSTDKVSGKCELLKVPEGSKAGEVVQFGGSNLVPDKQLHERKLKPILQDLTTNSEGVVVYQDLQCTVANGKITSSFVGSTVA
jgi:methionine--tRNA ligase beta chain